MDKTSAGAENDCRGGTTRGEFFYSSKVNNTPSEVCLVLCLYFMMGTKHNKHGLAAAAATPPPPIVSLSFLPRTLNCGIPGQATEDV